MLIQKTEGLGKRIWDKFAVISIGARLEISKADLNKYDLCPINGWNAIEQIIYMISRSSSSYECKVIRNEPSDDYIIIEKSRFNLHHVSALAAEESIKLRGNPWDGELR